MRIAVLTAFSALMLTPAASHAQQSADPSGVWLRDDGNARVRIVPCGCNMCVTNRWIRDTSKGEEAGDRLIMSLQPKSSDTLSGTAFDKKRERTYSITVQVSRGVLCKNVRWQPAR